MEREELERALEAERASREAAAMQELGAILRDLQARFRVDVVTVVRVMPDGRVVPGIELRAR